MYWGIFLIYGIIFAGACYYLAQEKGKDPVTWTFIGFFLGIIGLIMIGLSEKTVEEEKAENEVMGIKMNIEDKQDEDRLAELTKFEPLENNPECPVEIVSSIIEFNQDGHIANANISIRNKTEQDIIALKVKVGCFDVFNEPVFFNGTNIFEKRILDINFLGEHDIITLPPIELKGFEEAIKIKPVITAVVFSDDTIWNYEESAKKQKEESAEILKKKQEQIVNMVNAVRRRNPEPIIWKIEGVIGTYRGESENGKPSGWGEYEDSAGYKYIGEWKDGKRFGNGINRYSDGRVELSSLDNNG